MKRYSIHILVLAALLLEACNSPWEDEGGFIQFNPVALEVEEIGSRAPLNDLGSSFGVLGYCLANYGNTTNLDNNTGTSAWYDKYTRSRPHIFYNREIELDGTYTNAEKWLNSRYRYSFFAYAPYDATLTDNTLFKHIVDKDDTTAGTQDTTGSPVFTYTMPNTTNPADIPDAMVATAINSTELNGNVNLIFHHILSGIQLRLRNYDSPDLTIHSASISGSFIKSTVISFDTSGEVELNNTAERQTITYNLLDSDIDVSKTGESDRIEYIGEPIMLLADATNRFGSNLKLNISYTHKGANTISKTVEYPFNYPTGFEPLNGNIYTFELQFINNSLVLSLVVQNEEPWEEEEGDKDFSFE